MRYRKRKGQQEMVGFVLIVVLVMIALMVYFIISVTGENDGGSSKEADALLGAIFMSTTECATVYEPDYDTFEDLFTSCHRGKSCSNLGKDSCEYLEEELEMVIMDSLDTEADINYYSLAFYEKSEEGTQGILQIEGGNCTGRGSFGAIRPIYTDNLFVELRLCRDV